MPIKIQNDLPARAALESENIFVMDETRAMTQDIRPLQILILNIMPVKDDYETQLLRALSNTPLQVEVTFLNVSTHESTHTSVNHLNKFYHHFGEVKNRHFDGMIITGAPVEHLSFEEVEYWEELCSIMEWTKTHVTSTFHICWGAFAGMYYHYGIPKVDTKEKLSGVYLHRVLDRKTPLVRGFDDVFYAPESRYTGVRTEDVEAVEELTILADSERGGVFLAQDEGARKIFLFGHPEYDRMSLNAEYERDLGRGLNPSVPENYYDHDDPSFTPLLTWRCHAFALYSNWLNYCVYQVTPYDLEK